MPLYEYECHTHGIFEAVRSLADAAQPEACPDCGQIAARILSAPRLAQVGHAERVARDRNERSSHEPRLVRTQPKPAREERPALQRSQHSRPWALEHG